MAVHVAWPFAALALSVWGIGLVALVRFYRRARRRAERELSPAIKENGRTLTVK
jgi:TRAP-type C4-dicarboxylate transport system permease small subunit